jgi:hypothetical protein
VKAASASRPSAKRSRIFGCDTTLACADDALVDANARVVWLDVVLDAALARFVAQLIADCGGNRNHKTFRAIFPDAPNEIIRLGLESEVETLTALVDEVEHAKLAKPTLALWAAVTGSFPAATAALKARDDATLQVARVGLKLRRWKYDANGARRSIEVAIDQYAIDHGLARDYSGAFFPSREAPKKKRAAKQPDAPDAPVKPTA